MRAETIASTLGGRQTGGGWIARCPAHEDSHASLSIGEGTDRRVLLKCHAGCPVTAIVASLGLSMSDLFEASSDHGAGAQSHGNRHAHSNGSGLTLAAYAAAKQLPEAFLRTLGLTEISMDGRPAVRMPFLARDGTDASTRFRCALSGEGRFRWKKGTKPCLYGLWRLDGRPAQAAVVMVEGESDAQTLWFHDIPALGLPGAASWQESWAADLEDVPEILVVIEPDTGGTAVRNWLGKSRIRDRVRLVSFEGFKDVSELYVHNPSHFVQSWQAAVSAAPSWSVRAREEQRRQADALYPAAQTLLHAADLLAQLADAVRAFGYAGDPGPPLIAYLALTSRLLERPLNVAFVGPSGAGKNRAVDAALAFVPADAVHELKAGTPRALVYADADFAHRCVVVAEADSLPEDGPAASAVRSLITDNRLTYDVVEKNPKTGRHETRRIEKAGPTGLITTGTKSLTAQMSTRTLEVPLRDDAEQTRAIMRAHAQAVDETPTSRPEIAPFLALQGWLEVAGERRVSIPFSGALAELLPAEAVRMRRDFRQLLTSIQALALLRQCQRSRSATGAVDATIDDYAGVRSLLAHVFEGIATEGLTPAIRETVEAIRPDEEISETELANRLGVAKATASYRVRRALRRGWLINRETRKGCAAKLARGEPLPEAAVVLPSPDRVHAVFERSTGSPTTVPPPPLTQSGHGEGGR
jgi:hypothetical protein